MLTIRFNRTGRKNRPFFRVVLQEHTIAPGGRHVEVLGSYDPHRKQAVLKTERIQYWITQGAQPSDTAWNLLLKEKIVEGEKRRIKMKTPVKKEALALATGSESAETAEQTTDISEPTHSETSPTTEPIAAESEAKPEEASVEAETKA